MQTSQVPIWVPIIVGAIGLVGVLLGQVINGWRDKNKVLQEEAFRRAAIWRDKKVEIYVELIDLFQKNSNLSLKIDSKVYPHEDTMTSIEKFAKNSDKTKKFRPRLRLMAPKDVYEAYVSAVNIYSEFFQKSVDEYMSARNPDADLSDEISKMSAANMKMLARMRMDLGIPYP
ncbi:hypothetical protein ABT256_01725 [Amycolatopsis japonica]|uniref:hypothetical protein n=1 Tax=Amycolatopsis japonica TaxID=208439 RepID=UPI00332F9917